MNAALFMLTSAWMAGADVAVTPAPATVSSTPAVISTGSSCGGGCSTACDDPCASKPGFFSRFKGKIGGHKSACDTCATSAPVVHYKPAPIVAAPTCNTCSDPCASKPGLFSRLKSFGHKSSCGCETGCGTSTSACAGATTTVPGPHPEVIPPPKKEKEMPKGGTTGITIDPVVTPVGTPRTVDLNGQKNPF